MSGAARVTRASDAEQVAAYLAAFEPERKPLVEALRAAIIGAGPELAERIKWNAPSYHLDGTDMLAMNFFAKDAVRLVFVYPRGLPVNRDGLLEGDYKDRRLATFRSLGDLDKNGEALRLAIRDWIDLLLR